MDLGLTGKVALVSGATSGLGLAVARGLAAEDVKVAVCGRRLEVAEAEAATLTSAIGVQLDLIDPVSIRRVAEEVRTRLGQIDILVVNGGGPPASTAIDFEAEKSRTAAELLLNGPATLVSECLSDMRDRGWGRVVAVGSSAIQQPIPRLTTSGMFRSALASYLKLLSQEVATDGVTINMVLPGRIDTPRVGQLDQGRATAQGRPIDAVRQESEESIPLGRYGRPEEFAALVVFLCGEPASYITGEQLRVDGGMVRSF